MDIKARSQMEVIKKIGKQHCLLDCVRLDHMKYTDHQCHRDFYARNIQFEIQKKEGDTQMHVLTRNFEPVVLIQQWVERVNESKRQVSKELKSWTMRLF